MANFTSAHTGDEIDAAIASGSTTTGVIKDFNTLSGSLTSTINVGGEINTLSHITASGNISSSGTIFAKSLQVTHTTSSFVTSSTVTTEGNTQFGDAATDTHTFNGSVTASANISASGTIFTNDINIGGGVGATGVTIESDGNTTIDGNTSIGGFLDLVGTTAATNASGDTGILRVEGGASIAKNISLGTHITASGNISSSGTVTGTVTAASAVFNTVDINGGTINGITDLAVADGGTGASTFTDGGILLGNGTGAIQATAVLTDGQMLVGDGTTDPAIESGATLRTSIGVGTGDNVQFTNITGTGNTTLGNAAADTHTFVGHITASAYKISASAFIGDGSGLTGVAQDIDTLDAFSGVPHATQDEFLISDNGTEKRATMTMVANGAFALVSGEATVAAGGALTIAANVIGNNELKQDDDITLQSLTSAGTGSFGYATAAEISASSIILPNDAISGDKVEGGTIAATTITALTGTTVTGTTIKDYNTISGSAISTGSFARVENVNKLILSTQTVAAAGGDQAGATLIDANGGSTVFVTGADSAKGVRLPVVANLTIGQTFTIHNTVSGQTLKVYPGSGDKILPAADNTAITIAANSCVVVTHFSADGFVGFEPAVIVSD